MIEFGEPTQLPVIPGRRESILVRLLTSPTVDNRFRRERSISAWEAEFVKFLSENDFHKRMADVLRVRERKNKAKRSVVSGRIKPIVISGVKSLAPAELSKVSKINDYKTLLFNRSLRAAKKNEPNVLSVAVVVRHANGETGTYCLETD